MDSERDRVSLKQGIYGSPRMKTGNGLAVLSSDPKNLTEEGGREAL